MATFYVLPSRPQLGQRFAELLGGLFPSTAWPREDWLDLAEALGAAATSQPDVFVVFAEDLPADRELGPSLIERFGAEAGDDVVEIRLGRNLADVAVERWRVNESLAA
jgi:hypothetical protein